MSARNLSKNFMIRFPEMDRYAYRDDFEDFLPDGPVEFYLAKTFKQARAKCYWHADRMESLGIKVPAMRVVGINILGVPMFMEDIT